MEEKLGSAFDGLVDKLFGWMKAIIENLPNMAVACLVIFAAYFLSKYANRLSIKLTSKHVKQESINRIIAKLVSIMVIMLGVFLALGILDLSKTLTSLITGAGVLGLVIGLALQGTLSNTISGIVISFRDKIQIGNWVETNGLAGEIIDINLKNFTMKQTDNNIVFLPNKMILETPLKNYSLTPHTRCELQCRVAYDSNLELVEKLTLDTLDKTFIKFDDSKHAEFFFTEFAESSINFKCRFWIEGTKNFHKLHATNLAIIAIKKAFDSEGIRIPYPIRTLEFNNDLKADRPADTN